VTPYYADPWLTVYEGDCRVVLASLPAESVHTVLTSPPYWGLRDYGSPGQLGLEPTPEEYVANMVAVFREVRRVLRADGTLWLNLGDSYANDTKWGGSSGGKHVAALHGQTGIGRQKVTTGLKAKDLVGIPWRVAFALQADGWYLRSDIIWAKPNPMPESVTDRPTKAHEYLFLLSKSARYYYDADAVREAGDASAEPDDERPLRTTRAGRCIVARARNDRSRRPQPPLGLDRGDAALPRRSLRDLPTEADRARHQGRHERARRLPRVRCAVGAGRGAGAFRQGALGYQVRPHRAGRAAVPFPPGVPRGRARRLRAPRRSAGVRPADAST
jgi:hypothetical protein